MNLDSSPNLSETMNADGPKSLDVPIIIPAEELNSPALWPDDSLPEPGFVTRSRVKEQLATVYGGRTKGRAKIAEAMWQRFEFDTPYAKYYNAERLGVPGRFTLLREWNWSERFDVLERCHLAWERNPLARAGIEWTNHFVVGNGGQVTYHAKEVQDVLEEFREDKTNDIAAAEREFCTGLQVDGEIFIRYFKNRQGRTALVPIRPWHIHWIDTDPDNYKAVSSYHYVYTIYRSAPGASDFGTEDVPVADMLHVAVNKFAYVLRGRPDIFAILPWLKAYRDWLEERARLNRRKTIYYVLTLKNATPSQVASIQTQFATPPSPGSFLVVNENMELEVVQSNIHAEEALDDGRQIKLMAITGMLLPEFYFADGANSTLASATAQSLPALRKFDDYQDILEKQVWKPIYRQVIQNAVEKGRIPEMVQEIDSVGRETGRRIEAIKAFTYEYPEVKEKDPSNLAKALQIAVLQQWVSATTASAKMGFDPTKEREIIRLEAQANSGLVTPGVQKSTTPGQEQPGAKGGGSIVSPDMPQGQVQDRELMPSQATPSMPMNNPPSGGAG